MSDWSELTQPSWIVAPRLLGCYLIRELNGERLVGRIVETEAYDQTDAASHSYRGRSERNAVMFGPAGHLYVYFTYGMHYCCNVVTGPAGHGSAVLIRAVEPMTGQKIMILNRQGVDGPNTTNGPAKLCQALEIDKRLNGHDLKNPPLQLMFNKLHHNEAIKQSSRIGIKKAIDAPWRFYVENSLYVSKI